jgi:phage gpG-like protein
MFTFEITESSAVDAFNRLIALGEDPSGVLMGIGEVAEEFTKQRFELSQDPYGTPWAPNSDTTLRNLLHERSGSFTKKGRVSAKGVRLLTGKKPLIGEPKSLIGESKSLSTQIHYTVTGGDSVSITPAMRYAAMQHFGGTKAEFPHLWGDIPARAYFPDPSLGLPDELDQEIVGVLRTALEDAIRG